MSESDKNPGIDVSLPTLLESVRTLQTALQTKAKNEPAARFYSLWDKVCRIDVLHEAYRRSRANRGAPGVDGERFEDIENQGLGDWLERLQQEMQAKAYRPQPLLRVWIPKSNGGERPLGIPCIRDRVVQMAMLLVSGPIFDADLFPWQYGFREGMDAKMALRRIYFGASSVKSMGEFWLGKFAKCMIERDFCDSEGAKSVGFSHGHFDFVVHPLYDSAGELFFCTEIVEDEFAMVA